MYMSVNTWFFMVFVGKTPEGTKDSLILNLQLEVSVRSLYFAQSEWLNQPVAPRSQLQTLSFSTSNLWLRCTVSIRL